MKNKFIAIAIIFALLLIWGSDITHYLNLDYLKSQQQALQQAYIDAPAKTALIFFLTYVAVTALSLPGAVILTLAAGAIFGLIHGAIIVSFASTIGATLAFLIARYVLRDWVQNRFSQRMKAINQGIEKDGAFYLFTLRLIPVVPFFIINLVMGLTTLRIMVFFIVSQLGMIPATFVFINAGTELAKINNPSDVLSPSLLLSFVLIGLLPLLIKFLVNRFKSYKILRTYKKPKRFERNIIVIGAGSGGLVASYLAAALKAKVTLIEKDNMGGDCLNTGCVPSKALIRSARFLSHIKRAKEFGISSANVNFEFSDIMERVQRVIKNIAPHDSIERYTELGVEVIEGEAKITSPYQVTVNGQTLNTRNIIIATGAKPFIPPIPGLEKIDYLTSDNIWNIRQLPQKLLVLGGGPIGCELAQCFARLGAKVTQVEMAPRIMLREDPEISTLMMEKFHQEGIDVLVKHTAKEFIVREGKNILLCAFEKNTVEIEFDQVLIAVGRAANITGFGAEELGIKLNQKRTIKTNEFLQTNFPNIYACGDVTGPYQLTHAAAYQAGLASLNALFGGLKMFRADYRVIPWATFTEPEVARVGLNEQEATQQNIKHAVTTYGIDDLDRAIADEEAHGFVKILTVPGKDKILGVTIVGEHAGDLIAEFVLAMKHNIGLNKILNTVHIYPTLAEANKYAAGVWKRAQTSQKTFDWLRRFHAWRRNE